ncbi:hypothetical protein THAOC_17443, partial [Thalassiosira oceanica]
PREGPAAREHTDVARVRIGDGGGGGGLSTAVFWKIKGQIPKVCFSVRTPVKLKRGPRGVRSSYRALRAADALMMPTVNIFSRSMKNSEFPSRSDVPFSALTVLCFFLSSPALSYGVVTGADTAGWDCVSFTSSG